MEVKCYKTVGAKGRIYIPASVRQIAGIDKDDVVCLTGRNGVILINKAEVAAKNPIELLQSGLKREKEAMELEKDKIKNNAKKCWRKDILLMRFLRKSFIFCSEKGGG